MDFTFLHHPKPKKFEYKPRFYKPDAEPDESGRVPDETEQFARRLHREWDAKRMSREKKGFSKLTIVWILIILGLLLYFILR